MRVMKHGMKGRRRRVEEPQKMQKPPSHSLCVHLNLEIHQNHPMSPRMRRLGDQIPLNLSPSPAHMIERLVSDAILNRLSHNIRPGIQERTLEAHNWDGWPDGTWTKEYT